MFLLLILLGQGGSLFLQVLKSGGCKPEVPGGPRGMKVGLGIELIGKRTELSKKREGDQVLRTSTGSDVLDT